MGKRPKTTGTEWLGHSLASFNGSGYADRADKGSFIDSYIAYKQWKDLPDQAQLAHDNFELAQEVAAELLEGDGPGKLPSETAYRKFRQFYKG